MEERSKQLDDVQRDLKKGSGSLLANARKQQTRTVEEIADELNLSVTQIKTIELDQSEGLPEPTYVRGYIRSYAKLLGLDPEVVLENYLNPNWQKSSSLEDLPRGIGNAETTEKKAFITPTKAITVLVLIASLGFLWYSGMLSGLLGSNNDENSVTSSSSAPADKAANEVAETLSSSSQEDESESTAPADANEVTASDDTVLSDGENELVLNFAQTSWVDIRDGQDNRLAYKSYAEGEELRVSSSDSMSVFIGNAEGVTVEYNGEGFDIADYREGVYAKFTLGEASE